MLKNKRVVLLTLLTILWISFTGYLALFLKTAERGAAIESARSVSVTKHVNLARDVIYASEVAVQQGDVGVEELSTERLVELGYLKNKVTKNKITIEPGFKCRTTDKCESIFVTISNGLAVDAVFCETLMLQQQDLYPSVFIVNCGDGSLTISRFAPQKSTP